MPALLTAHAQAGMTESASTRYHHPPDFFTFPFFPASSIIIYFIIEDTLEWQRPVAITKLYVHVVENWPLGPLYVCLVPGG